VFQFLIGAIRQEKEIKATQIGNEEVKLFLFADYMMLYLKDPKIPPKTLQLINTFGKNSMLKNQHTKISSFSIMNRLRKKSGKQSHLH
jgi:hypothetical protein